ncbi:CLUMA_CG011086, isoform A [Clunio marinus]|uniref:CLUMA_CG011086, isoform A n=1 Tax=Clunio marinus TaxID=568069 RepID=A0A1J1ID83_9DIPT|nr:CLUMA_CG011086, isoform A [Clunio marinus]
MPYQSRRVKQVGTQSSTKALIVDSLTIEPHGKVFTHQSLSKAVKHESIAISEGSMSSDSIITTFSTRDLQFKAENQQTFNKLPRTVVVSRNHHDYMKS